MSDGTGPCENCATIVLPFNWARMGPWRLVGYIDADSDDVSVPPGDDFAEVALGTHLYQPEERAAGTLWWLHTPERCRAARSERRHATNDPAPG